MRPAAMFPAHSRVVRLVAKPSDGCPNAHCDNLSVSHDGHSLDLYPYESAFTIHEINA